jgi:RiboL-PSP-HEPN
LSEIDSAISKAKVVAGSINDPEVHAFFARYIVVFASGIYEDCIEHLFTEFAKKYGNAEIAFFMSKMLHLHFRNPEYGAMKGWLKHINSDYGDELDQKLISTVGCKDALDSVVTNKNEVAHGKSCSATLGDVEKYHQRVLPIFDAVEDILAI